MEYFSPGNISPPDNKNYEYAYNQSFQIAKERLLNVQDYASLCRNSGARYTRSKEKVIFSLEYVGVTYEITLPIMEFRIPGSEAQIPIRDKILLLHYLLTAKGTPLSGNLITFKELPEGIVYFRTFQQRTIRHIVNRFGQEPKGLIEAGLKINGEKTDMGDAGITIKALPRVPVTFVLWKGDEEFPAEASLLYDSTITDYLPVEDIIVLSEALTWKLVRA